MPDDPIYRGDDDTLTFTLRDANGNLENLTDKTLWFTAKRRLSDPDEAAVIVKESGQGIELLAQEGETLGQAVIEIDAADTVNLPNRTTVLLCDVQMLVDGKIRSPVRNEPLTVEPDVTRRTS